MAHRQQVHGNPNHGNPNQGKQGQGKLKITIVEAAGLKAIPDNCLACGGGNEPYVEVYRILQSGGKELRDIPLFRTSEAKHPRSDPYRCEWNVSHLQDSFKQWDPNFILEFQINMKVIFGRVNNIATGKLPFDQVMQEMGKRAAQSHADGMALPTVKWRTDVQLKSSDTQGTSFGAHLSVIFEEEVPGHIPPIRGCEKYMDHCQADCAWCGREIDSCGKQCFWVCTLGCLGCCRCSREMWSVCTGKTTLRDLRRECARRYSLPLDPSLADQDNNDLACCCIPLRTAVFFLSMGTFCLGLCILLAPQSADSDSHRFSGGYALASRVAVGLVQLTGIIMGLVGAIGALELRISLLIMYNYFQIARLLAMIFMIYTDVPLIADCELWRTDLKSAIKKHQWNPAMYEVAMANDCTGAQIQFGLGVTFHMFLYLYLISLTRKLIWDIEETPKYLLAMPRPGPSGAFMMYSRTQGKSKPPYGAMGYLSDGAMQDPLVGAPIGVSAQPGQYVQGQYAPIGMSAQPGQYPQTFAY